MTTTTKPILIRAAILIPFALTLGLCLGAAPDSERKRL